jgi:hypothetical protein
MEPLDPPSMPKKEHIDDILRGWPYEANAVSVRVVKGKDNREVIQMRLDMGLLQLEMTGRPDGQRPGGVETYFDHLLALAGAEGEKFELTEEQCAEADREFVQFYHRRICWLALREFARAVQDADHTLAFMNFCSRHSPDEQWTLSHEQYRPFVLFHRTQAAALASLEEVRDGGAEAAVEHVNEGLNAIHELFSASEAEDEFDEDPMVQRLVEFRETLREQFEVGKTLKERLDEAVAAEKYELAAKLRDELARQRRTGR